jgi:hypothetical protein
MKFFLGDVMKKMNRYFFALSLTISSSISVASEDEVTREATFLYLTTRSNEFVAKARKHVENVDENGVIQGYDLNEIHNSLAEVIEINKDIKTLYDTRKRSGANPSSMYRHSQIELLKGDGTISDEELEDL